MIRNAASDLAPHKICAYIYQLSDIFNSFYHDTPILREEDPAKKQAYLELLSLTERVLSQCIALLGFSAPDKM